MATTLLGLMVIIIAGICNASFASELLAKAFQSPSFHASISD